MDTAKANTPSRWTHPSEIYGTPGTSELSIGCRLSNAKSFSHQELRRPPERWSGAGWLLSYCRELLGPPDGRRAARGALNAVFGRF